MTVSTVWRALLVILCAAGVAFPVHSEVIISEFLAANDSGLLDEDGDTSDWIELHNTGGSEVSLLGWSLTDDASNLRKWLFPAVSIGVDEYLVVFASGNDRSSASAPNLHTNFQLDRSGEFLALVNSDGVSPPGTIFEPAFVEQMTDFSYGVHPTEVGYWFFETPTPGSANSGVAYLGVAEPPELSVKRGFYDAPLSVTLTSTDSGAEFYYTFDGRDPSPTTGEMFAGSISVSATSSLRVRAYVSDLLPSRIETHTYLIGENAAVKSLPVLSIVGDAEQSLVEPNGIMAIVGGHYDKENRWVADNLEDYNNPMQRGRAFERPVSLEYIQADGAAEFHIDCGIRVGGSDSHRAKYKRLDGSWTDCSSSDVRFSKFTFKTYFRDVYGQANLEFPLIPGAPEDVFDVLSLRGGNNDTCDPFLRDELVRRLHHDMGGEVALGTMVNVFINGVYKTYLNPTERYEEETFQNWHNTSNGFDILTQRYRDGGIVRSGDDVAWLELQAYAANYDLSIPTHYRVFGEMLDIPAFVDYLIAQLYSQNTDWPINNWTAAREQTEGSKWRFYLWDVEASFQTWPDISWTHFDRFPRWRPDFGTGLNGEDDVNSRIYRALKKSAQFQQLFGDHIARHFFNGGALTEENVEQRFYELHDILLGVLPEGDTYVVDTFVPQRGINVLNACVAEGMFTFAGPSLYIDGAPQHGGTIEGGETLTLDNSHGTGTIYYTLDGSDPLLLGETFTANLVTESNTRFAFVPTSSVDPFPPVLDTGAGWVAGTGGVGYERETGYESFIGLDVEQILYDVNGTCYIRIPFTLDGADLANFDTLILKMRYDDGYVAYINGTEVARRNAPDSVVWNSRSLDNRPDKEAIVFEAVDVSAFIDLLQSGENELAIHGLNSGATSVDFLISPELIAVESGTGITLSPTALLYTGPITLTGSVQVNTRVFDNDTWSALSEVVFAVASAPGSLRITELMYHPADGGAEYIELQNVSDASLDLTGVKFSDGIVYSFPAAVLQPGEFIVLVSEQDLAAFQAMYPDVPVFGTYLARLNNAGETVTLVAADGVTVLDSVSYDDSAPWLTTPDGDGYSLVLLDLDADPNDPRAWGTSINVGGSPGGEGELDACALFDTVGSQLALLRIRFNITEEDLDDDGLPEDAALALIAWAACLDDDSNLWSATANALEINLSALDTETQIGSVEVYKQVLAALLAVSQATQNTLLDILELGGVTLSKQYEVVTCDGSDLCLPSAIPGKTLAEVYEVFIENSKALDEPFSGGGDLDGDGTSNKDEYANVMEEDGTVDDFVMVATDPLLDGTEIADDLGCSSNVPNAPFDMTRAAGDVLVLLLAGLSLVSLGRAERLRFPHRPCTGNR